MNGGPAPRRHAAVSRSEYDGMSISTWLVLQRDEHAVVSGSLWITALPRRPRSPAGVAPLPLLGILNMQCDPACLMTAQWQQQQLLLR